MQYEIGKWRFDPIANELHRDGQVLKLERRAAEVLALLADNYGNVVSKPEILQTVWNGINVSGHSVAVVISALRQALGDNSRTPTHIETVPKRGYRLVAETRMLSAGGLDQVANEMREDGAHTSWFGRVFAPKIAAVFVLVCATTAYSATMVMDAAAGLGPDDGTCPMEAKSEAVSASLIGKGTEEKLTPS